MAGKLKLIFGDFLRSLHQLWLEVIGTVFLVFAVVFGFHAVREYRKFLGSSESGIWLITSLAVLSLLTLWFGIHSFLRARKLR